MSIDVGLDHAAICRAARRRGVAELSVFGSAVSGDFRETSDLDFLVDFLPGREDPFDDFTGLRDDLARISGRDVDLVVKRAIRNPYFRESVLSHAMTIYAVDV